MFILFTFLTHRLLPKYDFQMQLLTFQIKMRRDRIDDQRIVPIPEERLGGIIAWYEREAASTVLLPM